MSEIGKVILYFGGGAAMENAVLGAAFAGAAQKKKVLFSEFCSSLSRRGSSTFCSGDIHYLMPAYPSQKNFNELNDEEKRYALLDNTDYFESITKRAEQGYDLLILDRISDATAFAVLYEGILIDFLNSKPENLSVLISGTYASAKIAELADEITNFTTLK